MFSLGRLNGFKCLTLSAVFALDAKFYLLTIKVKTKNFKFMKKLILASMALAVSLTVMAEGYQVNTFSAK